MADDPEFSWVDYLIFILVLVISTGIGIFFAWKDRRKQNADDFLLGGRQMGILPVTLSLSATLLSAVMLLGVPAEVYYFGATYWIIVFSNFIVYPIAAYAFLPVYHNMNLTSAYEYLEHRFNRGLRVIGCVIFQIQMTLSMALALYAPAIALNQVMKIDLLVSILVIGGVCTFYTAIGGLKAVMWTDTFQMVIILVGFIVVLIKGSEEVGGFDVVWENAKNNSRLDVWNFDPNPLERHTFWTLVVGGGLTTLTVYGGNQAMVQRYLSMESVTKAQIALYLQLPAGIIITTLFTYAGLVLYAKYPVDPVQDCSISVGDQLVPWLVMDIMGDAKGFPGLLLACIFSASLSTVSSGINAVALVFMADIIQPTFTSVYGKPIQEPKATILSKIIGVPACANSLDPDQAPQNVEPDLKSKLFAATSIISGGVTIGLAFIAELFGDLILQVGLSIYGMIGGPLLGLFICAMFIPMVNEWGALVGLLFGLGMSSWLSIGAILMMNDISNSMPDPVCPREVMGNMTTVAMTTLMSTDQTQSMGPVRGESNLDKFYSLSYLWYSAFAVTCVIVVAVSVSCITGGTRRKPVDKRLLSPAYHKIVSFSSIQEDESVYTHQNGKLPAEQNGNAYIVTTYPSETNTTNGHINSVFNTKM